MSSFSIQFARRATGLAISFFALSAFAQTPHPAAAMPDAKPTAGALVAASTPSRLRYESVFARYTSYRDVKPGSWVGANETVDRIGGWRAYAREAQQPDAATPAKLSGPSESNPHAGHGSKP